MIWREPTNYLNNYYFCMVSPLNHGQSRRNKGVIEYPNIPPAIRPVSHSNDLPIFKPLNEFTISDYDEENLEGLEEQESSASPSQNPDLKLNAQTFQKTLIK